MATSINSLFRTHHRKQRLRFSAFGSPSAFGLRVSDFALALAPLLGLLVFTPSALAQPSSPRIGYVYPAGGRQGAVFQVAVGGQFLTTATNAYVSGPGVQAVVLNYSRPMTQKEFNDLRDKLKEMQDKRAAAAPNARKRGGQAGSQSGTNAVWTAEDERKIAEMRQKLALFAPKRNGNPAIAETVTVRVTLAPDAEPGERELRLTTPTGLSNPLRFCVGQLVEYNKREEKPGSDLATLRERRISNAAKAVARTEMSITLPFIDNDQIPPGGVHRYRFQARRGMGLVVVATARELIPYLPDAVPGDR